MDIEILYGQVRVIGTLKGRHFNQIRLFLQQLFQRLPDRDLQGADALDLALDLIARDRGGDARRRTRQNDVAWGKLDHLREFGDDFGHVPDHLIEIAVLADLAVDLEYDAALGGMADLGCPLERAARRRMIERFADLPRPLDVARGDLQIAPRQIDADAVAVDAIVRLRHRDIAAAALERDDQLDLVMHVLGQRRVGHRSAIRHDGIGRLGEEERRLAHVLSHLLDVFDIVAADAPQAADRKKLIGAGNGENGLRRRGNDVAVGLGAHWRI